MFKIFNFLKYLAMIAILGFLAVFSSVSFNGDNSQKMEFENSEAWQKFSSAFSFLLQAAGSLAKTNIERKIPVSGNQEFQDITNSFTESVEENGLESLTDISGNNSAWADFFAKIKEEWGNTNLD